MKRILFVEDNEVLLELYGVLLHAERDFWQTTLAPDGETALKLLQQTAFDVVVSDMQMPGINGIQLLAEVRKLHPQTSRMPATRWSSSFSLPAMVTPQRLESVPAWPKFGSLKFVFYKV